MRFGEGSFLIPPPNWSSTNSLGLSFFLFFLFPLNSSSSLPATRACHEIWISSLYYIQSLCHILKARNRFQLIFLFNRPKTEALHIAKIHPSKSPLPSNNSPLSNLNSVVILNSVHDRPLFNETRATNSNERESH